MKRASLLLHGGQAPSVVGDPAVTSILNSRLAALEGAESAVVLSSGLAATTCTMLALMRSGDHLVASSWLYGGTRQFLEQELAPMGIEVTFIDPMETRAWRKAMRRNTRVLFLESPVNPTTRVVDLRPARMLAQEHGVALVIDSTFATPINCRPLEHGADVVIHSATNYLNGQHDVLAGVVCSTEAVVDEVRAKMSVWGQAPDPFAVWMLERGLKTLDVRVQRQNASALAIAQWATTHAGIHAVHYPGLPSHPDHDNARAMLDGFGGMIAIEVTGRVDAAAHLLSKLTVFTQTTSLSGVESLVSEPRFTSHRQLSTEQRASMGIPDGLVRLRIGLEDPNDLIADLTQALEP